MNLVRQVEIASFCGAMEKWAQDQGFSGTLADLMKPVVYGIGGYAASRALGGERATGIPDYLLGPALGVGAAMPAMGAIGRSISNYRARKQMAHLDAQQQAQLEQALAREQELQAQMQAPSQDMLNQLAAYQMGVPPDAMMGQKMGQLRVPAQQADQIATNAQQQYMQGQQQQMQQQMQQAAIAQQIKGQFRGLQQNQARQARQQPQQGAGR